MILLTGDLSYNDSGLFISGNSSLNMVSSSESSIWTFIWLEKRNKVIVHTYHMKREKNAISMTVITFFCLCWAMGFPRGICFSFCISVRGDFVPRKSSLFQGDGLGENRTFDRAGMPFLFCLSPSPFSSKLGTFCPVYWKSQTLA